MAGPKKGREGEEDRHDAGWHTCKGCGFRDLERSASVAGKDELLAQDGALE